MLPDFSKFSNTFHYSHDGQWAYSPHCKMERGAQLLLDGMKHHIGRLSEGNRHPSRARRNRLDVDVRIVITHIERDTLGANRARHLVLAEGADHLQHSLVDRALIHFELEHIEGEHVDSALDHPPRMRVH